MVPEQSINRHRTADHGVMLLGVCFPVVDEKPAYEWRKELSVQRLLRGKELSLPDPRDSGE